MSRSPAKHSAELVTQQAPNVCSFNDQGACPSSALNALMEWALCASPGPGKQWSPMAPAASTTTVPTCEGLGQIPGVGGVLGALIPGTGVGPERSS